MVELDFVSGLHIAVSLYVAIGLDVSTGLDVLFMLYTHILKVFLSQLKVMLGQVFGAGLD